MIEIIGLLIIGGFFYFQPWLDRENEQYILWYNWKGKRNFLKI